MCILCHVTTTFSIARAIAGTYSDGLYLVENYVELLKTGNGSTCLERLNGSENDSELKVK